MMPGSFHRVGQVLRRIPVRRVASARGEAQTRRTLQVMAELAAGAAIDPELVAVAVNIVRSISARDSAGMVQAIRGWTHSRLEFLPDPIMDGDFIRTPAYLLAEIREHGAARGDCDDAAVLVAALGMAIGLRARIRAVAFEAWRPFEHVWAELRTPAGWFPIDPTRGEPIHHIDRHLVVEV